MTKSVNFNLRISPTLDVMIKDALASRPYWNRNALIAQILENVLACCSPKDLSEMLWWNRISTKKMKITISFE